MSTRVNVENPNYLRTSTALSICVAADIGATDDTWVNQKGVQNVEGYKKMTVWVKLTVNDSTGNQVQILSGESNSTATYILPTASQYLVALGDADLTDGIAYEFNLENVIKYVQFQTKATDVDTGGGTEGTISINYTLGY